MTKKVINEEELIKREEDLKEELHKVKEQLNEINNPESTYKFEGSGVITMDCTVEANSQKEAQELAKEVLDKAIAWAISYTQGDLESGNFFLEFTDLENENDMKALLDANVGGHSEGEITFISKNVEDYEDNR